MSYVKNMSILLVLTLAMIAAVCVYYKEAPALQTDQEKLEIDVTIPEGAKRAAEKGLSHYRKYISGREQQAFNFSSQEQVDNSKLGNPFRVFTIKPQSLSTYNDRMSFYNIISPTNTVFFPVVADGTTRTILSVGSMDGVSWEASGMGHSGLAKTWDSIEERWPSSDGYEHIFIRVYQKSTDFVLFRHKEKLEGGTDKDGIICLQVNSEEVHDPSDPSDMMKFLQYTLGK